MELLVKELVAVEQKHFDVFDEYIAKTIVEGWAKAISHHLKTLVQTGETAELEFPHGTYSSAIKSNNINVAFVATKDFLAVINSEKEFLQKWETFDEKFIELFRTFVDYGESSADHPNVNENRLGIDLSRNEAIYFIRSISNCIASLCKQFEKPGKEFIIDIAYHGNFMFTYADKTTIRFVADEAFKQAVKNDEAIAGDSAIAAFTSKKHKKKQPRHDSIKLVRV